MYTKWGEELNPDHVLMEYPRPQMVRSNFTILNGYWNYTISKDSSWPAKLLGKILVPFSPESILSGVNQQLKPDEYLWYERKLLIENKHIRHRCLLQFGAVDQYCELYVNQNKVMEHRGGYLPFTADITEQIRTGENVLRLKVTDYSDQSYLSRGKQKLDRGGMFYTAQSGIWQTVWMEWVPDKYIRELQITPMLDKHAVSIKIRMNTEKPADGSAEMKEMEQAGTGGRRDKMYKRTWASTFSGEEELYRVEIYAGTKLISSMTSRLPDMTIPMENIVLWSPEIPFLYDMVITAGNDSVKSYFAMRKIEVKRDEEGKTRIFFNDSPYFQNGILDQGYWPDGLYTAPSDEALVYDISLAKDLGFNMLRKHLKIEPLRWYYHCDRLGMIVWQDMVNGGSKYSKLLTSYIPTLYPRSGVRFKDNKYRMLGRQEKEGREEWAGECMETVRHLYNSPCIAVWVLFNEGWGQFDSEALMKEIQNVDKTRLIDPASGWFDQKAGDFKSVHNYFHPLKVVRDKRAVVLSEYGGYVCYIKEHSFSDKVYGYHIYMTEETLAEGYQNLIQQVTEKLQKKGLAAAVYTQLSDVEDEVNGLVTYDRKICKVKSMKESKRII